LRHRFFRPKPPKILDSQGVVPIIGAKFFCISGEEKEVIMRSQRNSFAAFSYCVRDIPET